MANLTQFAQKKLLDKTLGLADWALPTTYLGLATSNPGETGSLAGEPSGGNYARVALAGKITASVLGTGRAQNGSVISFPAPSAAWNALTHAFVADAASAGNVLVYLPLATALLVGASSPAPTFILGSLIIDALFLDPSQLTQYLAKKWNDHVLGIAAFTMPASLYLGLFSADPTETGSLANEIAIGGYARQIITTKMDATTLATGIAQNNDAIAFPTPTANYGVTHYGLMDAAAAGNMLFRKARSSTLNVTSGGAAVRIDAGQLALRAS